MVVKREPWILISHTYRSECVSVCRSPISLTRINSIPTVSIHSHSFPSFTVSLPGYLPPTSSVRWHIFLHPSLLCSPLSSHFLHHDPLLCLFKPVLLSLPLLVSPSTRSLILCFLILPRETPDIRFIHSSLVSEPPPLLSLCCTQAGRE